MIALLETVILCALFFILCVLGTGSDEKNLKSYAAYPDAVQKRIQRLPAFSGKFQDPGKLRSFLSNFLLFLVLFLILGLFFRRESFLYNFLCLTLLGQGLNLFDLLVIDLLWWRNSPRIRFTGIPEKALYRDPRKHVESFLRALLMYLLIALIDGWILTLF